MKAWNAELVKSAHNLTYNRQFRQFCAHISLSEINVPHSSLGTTLVTFDEKRRISPTPPRNSESDFNVCPSVEDF